MNSSILMLLGGALLLAQARGGEGDPPAKPRNRLVRVVTVTQDGLGANANLETTLERLDRAAGFRPDIACLPEHCAGDTPEAVPGPSTEKAAKWAKEHRCYLICPLLVKDGGKVYNAAVLLDRAGEIAGQYRKIHPTEGEMEKGICPGAEDPPVFKTDFGTIGIQICFDVNWPAPWRALKDKGAEIVFWPSAYPATRILQAHAWQERCFVVSSTKDRTSSIFDISGTILESTGRYQPWAGAILPLDKQLFEIDYHTKKLRELQKKYGDRVQVTWFHDEDWVTLASLDPDLTVADLMKEYGLVPLTAYHARCEKAQAEARKAQAPAAAPVP
ncbi:MAG: carbon-nitrogen hydrolase family protein [Planctomycetota bacterium]|nr:carbon-nitrogen hydrolase family protein [Planctomycetota bacterium]